MQISRRIVLAALPATVVLPIAARAQDAAQKAPKIVKDREEMGRRVELSEVPPPARQAAESGGYPASGAVEREVKGRKVYEIESRDTAGGLHRVEVTSDGRIVRRD